MTLLVTTSWDDGHRQDLRLAALLKAHRVPGTFYVAPRNREIAAGELLTDEQVKDLAADFEIGSHSMTHPVLTRVPEDEVRRELATSKEYLSALVGTEVTSFCYPRGSHDPAIAQAVQDAGYTYARTVRRFELGMAGGRFMAGTTLEAHRSPLPRMHHELASMATVTRYRPVRTLRMLDWEQLARQMFDQAVARGGVFHLWGHSWVVERAGDWDRLDRVLAYISGHPRATYVTNAELSERWSS
jgi:peptidoglycan-N-acetylglucosamine deacetylase